MSKVLRQDIFGPKSKPDHEGDYCDDPTWKVYRATQYRVVYHRECPANKCAHCGKRPIDVAEPVIAMGNDWLVL